MSLLLLLNPKQFSRHMGAFEPVAAFGDKPKSRKKKRQYKITPTRQGPTAEEILRERTSAIELEDEEILLALLDSL